MYVWVVLLRFRYGLYLLLHFHHCLFLTASLRCYLVLIVLCLVEWLLLLGLSDIFIIGFSGVWTQLQRPRMGFLLLASGKTELLRFSLSAGATYCCSNGCCRDLNCGRGHVFSRITFIAVTDIMDDIECRYGYITAAISVTDRYLNSWVVAPVASWCQPQVVHVKCNVDTAFSEDGQ
ncbi:hypothetical protein Godav_004509 [Gossypium davidsonii]|uniref:Uncharacterized protein n=1 Tax=Gossypium davidsonii TaxID=34287 RepID=A0A7J8SMA3_GOSDV|nr:hypothetical protein [Gossypium davidsonii]